MLPPRLTWEEDANHQYVLFRSVRNESLENGLHDVGVHDDVDWAALIADEHSTENVLL
jgi:hypothetical protein